MKNIGIGRHAKSQPRRRRATLRKPGLVALPGAPRGSGPEFPKVTAGTILDENGSGPGPGPQARGPIGAGIAGSSPDLTPGPASCDEHPLSRCSVSPQCVPSRDTGSESSGTAEPPCGTVERIEQRQAFVPIVHEDDGKALAGAG